MCNGWVRNKGIIIVWVLTPKYKFLKLLVVLSSNWILLKNGINGAGDSGSCLSIEVSVIDSWLMNKCYLLVYTDSCW